MTLTIKITDEDTIDSLKAVGAQDILEYFLPKIGIIADKVYVHELLEAEKKKMLSGESFTRYQDNYPTDEPRKTDN